MKMKTQYIPNNLATTKTNNLAELYARTVIEIERIERGVSYEKNPEQVKKLHKHLQQLLHIQ